MLLSDRIRICLQYDGLGACFSGIGSDLCGVTYSDKQYVLDTDKSSVYGSTLVQQETDQLLTFHLFHSSSNPNLFAEEPTLSQNGTLKFRVNPDQFGSQF